MKKNLLTLSVLLCVCLATSSAFGQAKCPPRPADPARAKDVAKIWWKYGLKFHKSGLLNQAIKAWICCNSLAPHPTALYNIARTAEQADKPELALKYYKLYITHLKTVPERKTIELKILALKQAIADRKLTVPRPPRIPRPIRPTPPTPRPPPPVTPKPPKPKPRMRLMGILGWTSVGLGAALTIVGIAMGGLAAKAKSRVEDANEGTNWATLRDAYDSYDGYVIGTGVCIGLGLAAAGAGATLLILDRRKGKEREKTNVTATAMPGGGMLVVGGRL
jgi:hypothetical protein